MVYVTTADLAPLIKDEHLSIIKQNSDTNLQKAEMAAKEEMAAYLSSRYNVSKIFLNVAPWSSTKTYNEGDHAFDSATKKLYIAKQASTNQALGENAYWKEGDNRNQVIVMYLVDMILYHLHSSINPRNIPELRGFRYEAARQWLRDVAKLIINPDLPLLTETGDKVDQVLYGGNTKNDFTW